MLACFMVLIFRVLLQWAQDGQHGMLVIFNVIFYFVAHNFVIEQFLELFAEITSVPRLLLLAVLRVGHGDEPKSVPRSGVNTGRTKT